MFPFISVASKWVSEAAIKDMSDAYIRFFKKQNKHPKFHKKGIHDSFRIDGSVVKLDGKYLHLPKKLTIKMAEELRFNDVTKIDNVTVSKKADRWFVSVLCEIPDVVRENQGTAVGIDMGLKELATLSDGVVYDNPRWYVKRQRRLAHLQRGVSRKVKGSRNRDKAKARVAKYQYQTICKKMDYLHKCTSDIANSYSVAFVEDLNIDGMKSNHHLAKSVSDACMSTFLSQLDYKMPVAKIDRWYPSSKTCSNCGHVQDMPLSERTYECPECGMVMDRDLNAAHNIYNIGMANYSESKPVENESFCSVKQESTSKLRFA
jgi:putative transposase